MPHIQSELLRQLREGPSARSHGQENIQQPAGTALSNEKLARLNQAVLATFLEKADADPNNMQSSKDYCKDLLEELAGWLKGQTYYPRIRSLQDLLSGLANCKVNVRELEENFIADGAKLLAQYGQQYTIFNPIINALRQSHHEPKIKLPISQISRQDEKLLHAFTTALTLKQDTGEGLVKRRVYALKVLCKWLLAQTASGQSIPHGLDSLEKLRDHPDEKEVEDVICQCRDHPDTSDSANIKIAVQSLRELKPQVSSPVESRIMQPALHQQQPVRPDQSASPASPSYLSKLDFAPDEIALLRQAFPAAFSDQFDAAPAIEHSSVASTSGTQPHGVRRPAPPTQDESRAVRPRLDNNSHSPEPEEWRQYLNL